MTQPHNRLVTFQFTDASFSARASLVGMVFAPSGRPLEIDYAQVVARHLVDTLMDTEPMGRA